MYLKRNIFLCLTLLIVQVIISQPSSQSLKEEKDTTYVNNLLQQSRELFTDDTTKAISLAKQAKDIADEIDYPKGSAIALKNIGITYFLNGNHLEALNYYDQSLQKFISINDHSGIANLYSNIGAVYYERGDETKALENYLQSLRFSEQANDKFRILIALNNVGGIYFLKPATYDKSLDYYLRAQKLCEELDKKEELGIVCVNIGSIYYEKNDNAMALSYFQKALAAFGDSEGSLDVYNGIAKLYKRDGKYELAIENHNKALAIAEKVNNKTSIQQSLMGLGNVYLEKGEYNTALQYFKKAEIAGLEVHVSHELKDLYQVMAKTYSKMSDYKNAFKYQSLYSGIKNTMFTLDITKKVGTLMFEYDLRNKQTEISLLTKDKDLQAASIKRQKLAKNAFMIGLVLAFIIAALIFRSYRIKAKTHKILDKQKNEIEGLLLNILPREVAGELQRTGHATPKHYDSASVMFTDFKSFTVIADNMSPKELVEELDACFIAFDGIIAKYDLEKIKTIGDSYMCAGGIPTPDETHVLKIVKAGLEIQQYIAEYNAKRKENGLEPWNIRIGIHVGPIVAGVVGKKKYAYDIWGSTVNIASRMESNGEPGKVNISSATYELIKDYYECSHRGKISAKNIGEIDMYFIEYEYSIPRSLINTSKLEVKQ